MNQGRTGTVIALWLALFILVSSFNAAYATKYVHFGSGTTSTVRTPTVQLQGGTVGSSTISNGVYATASVAASLLPLYYVLVTITNNQGSGTPTPFQVLIQPNPSLYSAYEASDLGNIRFCADIACSTQLYAWLESCATSCGPSATSSNVWVRLTSSIGANGGTLTIYMVFLSTGTDFDNAYWGEAPGLSTTYGAYDNGANVFTEYNNGNSLFANGNTGTGGSGPSVTTAAPSPFTHAITGSVSGGSAKATTWTTSGNTGSPSMPSSFIAQMLVRITGSSPLVDLLTNVASITNGQFYVFRFDARSGDQDMVGYYPAGASTATIISASSVTSSTGVWYQMTAVDAADKLSLYKASAGSVSNFGTLGTAEVSSVTGQGYTGGGLAVTTDGATSTDYFTLILVRAYPPGNVMPSSAFGSLTVEAVLEFTNSGSTSWLVNLVVYTSTNTARLTNLTLSFRNPYSKQIVLGTVTNQLTGPQVTMAASSTMLVALAVAVSSSGTTTVTLALKVQVPPTGGSTSSYCDDIIYLTVT